MFLKKFFRAEERKSELDEEIAAHLAMAAADKQAQGHDAETAHQEAAREFGNTALIKDVTREAWGWQWLERILQDVKYAARQMRKSPGFACTVIGTLAIGIAAATAMFTIVDRVLLRPLPYPNASRLMQIHEGDPAMAGFWNGIPYLDIAAWRSQAHSFQQIGYFSYGDGRNFIQGSNASAEISFLHVSSNFFQMLRVQPELGPGLPNAQESAKSSSGNSVMLSDSAWRTLFGADRTIIGKIVRINGQPYTVAGIMPRSFLFPLDGMRMQAWIPIALDAKDWKRNNDTPGYEVIARLRPGIKQTQAQAELATLQKHIAQNYSNPDRKATAGHVQISVYGAGLTSNDTRRALYSLLAAALLLWFIACVNATNLLLVRALNRQREIAMRGALGARKWHILQQFAVEGLLLSACGAVIGLGLSLLAIKLFAYGISHHLPANVPVTPNAAILAALLGLILVSSMLASVWPAWIAVSAPIEPALRQGGAQSGTSRSHNRIRNSLVITEIALSLMLLTGCGLMLRTIYALRHVPLGFRTDHIIVATLDLPSYRFQHMDASADLYRPLIERVKGLPGIDAAGLMTDVPLSNNFFMTMSFYGDKTNGSHPVTGLFKAADPSLQQVFGFKMFKGRYFNQQDTASSEPVIVVNRAFAHAYTNEQDLNKVIGMKVLHLGDKSSQPASIIGILDDFRQDSVDKPSQPEIQVDFAQITPKSTFYIDAEGIAMDLALRTQRPLNQVIPELREALRQASPELANSKITTMDQIVEDSYGSQMLAAHLLEIFAASALLLCVAGLYGLLAYVVSQRTREMGVRFALGAQRGDVIWLILRQAGVLVITGIAIGLALAYASTRFIRSYLYGVSAHDGLTLISVALVLVVSGAIAAWLPARRAAQVNPVEALRAD